MRSTLSLHRKRWTLRLQDQIPRYFRRNVIVIYPWKVAYVRVPKVANSALKSAIAAGLKLPQVPGLRPTNDRYWRCADPKRVNLISLFQFEYDPRFRDYWSFAVVREPVERIVSCYKNKILRNGRLSPAFQRRGFSDSMSLEAFVRRACVLSDVSTDIHLASQASILGQGGRSSLDLVLSLDELNHRFPELVAEVWKRSGVHLGTLGLSNSTAKVKDRLVLTPELRCLIRRRYEADYRLFFPNDLAGAAP